MSRLKCESAVRDSFQRNIVKCAKSLVMLSPLSRPGGILGRGMQFSHLGRAEERDGVRGTTRAAGGQQGQSVGLRLHQGPKPIRDLLLPDLDRPVFGPLEVPDDDGQERSPPVGATSLRSFVAEAAACEAERMIYLHD